MLLDMERTVIDVEIGDLQIHAPSYLDEPSLYTVIDDVDTLIPTLEAAGFRASPQSTPPPQPEPPQFPPNREIREGSGPTERT